MESVSNTTGEINICHIGEIVVFSNMTKRSAVSPTDTEVLFRKLENLEHF